MNIITFGKYKGGATQHNLLWKAMGNIEDALKELEDE